MQRDQFTELERASLERPPGDQMPGCGVFRLGASGEGCLGRLRHPLI